MLFPLWLPELGGWDSWVFGGKVAVALSAAAASGTDNHLQIFPHLIGGGQRADCCAHFLDFGDGMQ